MLAQISDVGLSEARTLYGDLGMHAVMDLRRSFSARELERAVDATIADFPVLGCAYEPRFWRDRWRRAGGPTSEAVHVDDACEDLEAHTRAWVQRPIRLAHERPLRVVSLNRAKGSRLILSMTHVAVDGGGLAAVGHVFGSHLYGVPPAAPADARRSVGSALGGLRWYHAAALARDVAKSFVQPIQTLAAARRERPYPADAGEASWRTIVLDAEHLARIKASHAEDGASVNDVLIAALARASATRSRGGPVAVMYTMDLRRYAKSPRLTAANTSSLLVAIVPREATGDLARTVSAVAAITSRHKRSLAGPAFIVGLVMAGAGAPHGLVRRLVHWLLPTIFDLPMSRGLLLTNVGKIDQGLAAFGDDIESVRIVGPCVRGTPTPVVVAYGFRGEVHLQLFAGPGLAVEALDELEVEIREGLELAKAAS